LPPSSRPTWSPPALMSSTKPTKTSEDRQSLHVAQVPKSVWSSAPQISNPGSQPRQQALESDVSATAAMLLVAVSSTLDLSHVDPSELENSAQLAHPQTAGNRSRFRAGACAEGAPSTSRTFGLRGNLHRETSPRPLVDLNAACIDSMRDVSFTARSRQPSLAPRQLPEMRVAAPAVGRSPAHTSRLGYRVQSDRDVCVDYVDGIEITQSRLPFCTLSGDSNWQRGPSSDVYESVPVDSSKLLLTLPAANLLASKRLQDLKAKLSLRGMLSQSAEPLTVELVPDKGDSVAAETASSRIVDRVVSLKVAHGTAAKRSLQAGIVSPSGTCSGAAGAAVSSRSELSRGSGSNECSDTESDSETAFEPAYKVPRLQA
jgi:hypothetical protein